MSNPNIKYRVELTLEQREELIEVSKNGKKTAKQVNHANVLLMADDQAGSRVGTAHGVTFDRTNQI